MPPVAGAPIAGEKFFDWIKSCKKKAAGRCLKKFITHKTIVKSGEKHFLPVAFFSWHRRC